MTAEMIAGAVLAALVGLALLKAVAIARKVRRTLRRWSRTRLVFTQTIRRRRH